MKAGDGSRKLQGARVAGKDECSLEPMPDCIR